MDMSLLQTKMKPATPLPELRQWKISIDGSMKILHMDGRIKTEERIPAK